MSIADLHVHTNYSYDGISSPEEVVDYAIKKGLDCICITDHGEIEGAFRAIEYAKDKNILVIPGIEVLTKSGDILGINIKERIPEGLSLKETIKEIKRQKGFPSVAHPFDWPIENFLGSRKDIKKVKAVEVFNASTVSFKANKEALDFSKENNLFITAGSDAHRAEYIGRGYLETSEDFSTAEELIDKIKKRQVKAKGKAMNLFQVLKNASGFKLKRAFDYWTLKKEK